MLHEAVISTLVAALGLAFLFGAIANHLRLPTIVGYLLAGVVLGPFTPGIVADQNVKEARALSQGDPAQPWRYIRGYGLRAKPDETVSRASRRGARLG